MQQWIDVVWEAVKASSGYALAGVAWLVLAAAAIFGFAGVFVPVIPGALVLAIGALIHKWMLPEFLSWWTIGGLAFLVVLDRVVDFGGTALGARWFGGTKWGVLGALVGGFVGLFLGIIGIIIGPVIGAVVFELIWARSHPRAAARSGVGAGIGFGISTVGRLFVFFVMVAAILADLVINDEGLVEPPPEAIAESV